jgi:hypothetical protein
MVRKRHESKDKGKSANVPETDDISPIHNKTGEER